MTEYQLEVAARELCRLRGINPDTRVGHGPDPSPDGSVCDVYLYSPAWTRALREIEGFQQIATAVAVGKEAKEKE